MRKGVKRLIMSRVHNALKYKTTSKQNHTIDYLGCSSETLHSYLENQFTNGMNWENQGLWHMDHIRPCSSFNFENEEEIKMCFHYTNLQPLWASDNLTKSSAFNENDFNRKWNGTFWELKPDK